MVWDYTDRRIILQHPCGGGHRSWDFYHNNNCITFTFLKEQTVYNVTTNWSISPTNILKGLHSAEINSIKIISNQHENILLSGGEDTTLQLSVFCGHTNEFNTIEVLKSHLSSIRCIATCCLQQHCNKKFENYLIFTAGGRAQIILWLLTIDTERNQVNCYEKYSYYENLGNTESEMRIMDLTVVQRDNYAILSAACSDGKIKFFSVYTTEIFEMKLVLLQALIHRSKCILKICNFVICDQTILVTMTIEGKIIFWNIEDLISNNSKCDLQPFYEISAHQSGINSYSYKLINNTCIFLTGGDDNAIVLHTFDIKTDTNNALCLDVLCKYVDVSSHCAQITGTFISDKYFITTSVDQKVLIFEWNYCTTFCVNLLGKYNSAVADIQGMQVLDGLRDLLYVVLYGKGIEIITILLE